MRRERLSLILLTGWIAWGLGCSGGQLDWQEVEAMIRRDFPSVRHLAPEELEERLQSPRPPLLIDARSSEEFSVSHLPRALHARSVERIAELRREHGGDRDIVVYCSVGYRSSALAARLQNAGISDVYNLRGSIFQWANEGRPVVRQGVRVSAVHPFDRRWGQLLRRELWTWEPEGNP